METTVITNITEYEENILAGMTGRQLALGIAGILLIVLSYTTLQSALSLQAASYIAIGAGLPCFLFAFARPQKMRLEQYLVILIKSELLSHRKRHFEAENGLYNAIFVDEPKAAKKTRKGGKRNGTMETESK